MPLEPSLILTSYLTPYSTPTIFLLSLFPSKNYLTNLPYCRINQVKLIVELHHAF